MDIDPAPASTLEELERLWLAMTGRRPQTLGRDMRELERWFGPTASGAKLRERVEARAPAALNADLVPDYGTRLVIEGGDSVVVTPEGRMTIDLLRRGAPHEEVRRELATAGGLGRIYRRWTQYRLVEVIDHLEGRGKRMYPVAAGAVLLLAVNGNESESRALRVEPGQPSEVRDALKRPLDTFADAVEGRKCRPRASADLSKYPIAHAKIRLGHAVRRERAEGVLRIWLDPPTRDWTLDVVAHELVGRHGIKGTTALAALDGLIESYLHGEAVLRGRELAFSTPESLAEVRRELAARFARGPRQLSAGACRPQRPGSAS
jgi:hypothetical protein